GLRPQLAQETIKLVAVRPNEWGEDVKSTTRWSAGRVEHEGAALSVMVPASNTARSLPMKVSLTNDGRVPFLVAASGYLLHCRVTIRDKNGTAVPYTVFGSNLVGPNGGHAQGGVVPFYERTCRTWQFDLVESFTPLRPGKYLLSLEADLLFGERSTRHGNWVVTLETADIPFTVTAGAAAK
ncbi:MAG: hypothetical protein AAF961_06090, partial [Planctomycetota bacterium]